MTCDHALEALLDADLPDVLNGRAPLALHVRNCNRCRAVAETFVTETRLLANTVSAAPRRRARSHSMMLAPMAAAAALLVVVATHNTDRAPVRTASVLTPVVVQPEAAVALLVEPEPQRERPALRAFPQALPFAAVKLETAALAVAESAVPTSGAATVSVTPPAGTRAVVMHTNDPKLVVVWLY